VDITQYVKKLMLAWWYLTQGLWPWGWTCTKLFLVHWSPICHVI